MDWDGWLIFGLIATAALTAVMLAAQLLGRTRLDVPLLLGTLLVTDPDRARVAGFFIHLVNGQAFALGYAAVFAASGEATWWAGALLGLLHGSIALLVIVPFLVWYHRYMGQIGRAQVPLMKDLVDEGRGKIGFIMYHSALVMTAVALLTGVSEAGRAIAPLIAVAFLVLASDLVPLFAPVPEAGTEPDPRPSTARAAADAGAATSSGGAGFKRTR